MIWIHGGLIQLGRTWVGLTRKNLQINSNQPKKMSCIRLLGVHYFQKWKIIQKIEFQVNPDPTHKTNVLLGVYGYFSYFDENDFDVFRHGLWVMILTYLGYCPLAILMLILVIYKYFMQFKCYHNITFIFANTFMMNFIERSTSDVKIIANIVFFTQQRK